ncbi:MAG: hypothetical protein ACXWXI_07455, partial [Aeromicrobium sp.]
VALVRRFGQRPALGEQIESQVWILLRIVRIGRADPCRIALRASLLNAVDRAQDAQGVAAPDQRTYDKSIDYRTHRAR